MRKHCWTQALTHLRRCLSDLSITNDSVTAYFYYSTWSFTYKVSSFAKERPFLDHLLGNMLILVSCWVALVPEHGLCYY